MVSFSFHLIINLIFRDFKDVDKLNNTNLPIQIPQIVPRWMITVLVLHIAAALEAFISVFILFFTQHYISTFVSGLAAVITLCAFAFDIALFFVARNENPSKSVTSAETPGIAVWLTLAAFFLLLIGGVVDHLSLKGVKLKVEVDEKDEGDEDDES